MAGLLYHELVTTAGGEYYWKLESELQEGDVRVKPCEISVGTEDSAEIIADLEGYARRKFSVPECLTADNNYHYRQLLQSLATGVFYSFGESFRDAVEDIVNDIQEMRAAL
ncbi:MAG: hypothetical protein IKZ87_01330 [Actinomycetaceae bacterium]|nr:hypothetical protein [Actinomycetaceae bacterium]